MSKIKKADLLQLMQEQADMVVELAGMVEKNKQSIIKLENEREQPQLKQLDQGVFDGLPSEYKWIARDRNGDRYAYAEKPHPRETTGVWVNNSELDARFIGAGYDATNWQNSLIERDIAAELLEIDLELPSVCPTCGRELED